MPHSVSSCLCVCRCERVCASGGDAHAHAHTRTHAQTQTHTHRHTHHDPGHNTPEFLHILIEAIRLSFADTRWFVADPAVAAIPVDQLLSKAYAAQRRALIDTARAATAVEVGSLRDSSDTVRERVRVRVCMYVRMCVCVCVWMWKCVCVCVSVCVGMGVGVSVSSGVSVPAAAAAMVQRCSVSV